MRGPHDQKEILWQRIYPEFAGSTEPAIRDIIENAGRVEVPAGSLLMSQGMRCEHYLFVTSGRARVHVVTESGREIVLYYVGPGDTCVLSTSCVLSQEAFPAGIMAETDMSAFATSATLFEQAIDQSAPFRRFVFRKFGERLVEVLTRMEQLCAPSIERHLAQALLELSQQGSTIETTHQDLALRLGTAREVVSRHLKQFETHGWVRLARGRICIASPQELRRVAG